MLQALIGISFLSVIADVFLIQGQYKKYVRSVVGALALLILLQSLLSVREVQIDYGILEEAQRKAGEQQVFVEEKIKEEALLLIEKRIQDVLLKDGILTNRIQVEFLEDYQIKKVRVSLKDTSKYQQRTIDLLVDKLSIPREVLVID